MDFENMELDELKDYAKSIGISFSGNIGKAKLIEKIKEAENTSASINSVINDMDIDDMDEDEDETEARVIEEPVKEEKPSTASLLNSITSAIDELEGADNEEVEVGVDLPLDTVIPVKSITYGELVYKSRSTNAMFIWNKIGAVQYMTVAELNEMNNYKESFLRKPLVILMDERAVKKFRLTSVYENVAKINDLTNLFKSDLKTIETVIDDALTVNMRDILVSKVRQMYSNGKLTNVNVLRLIERKLHIDLIDSE